MSEVKKPKLLFPASPRTISNESQSHDRGQSERPRRTPRQGPLRPAGGFHPFTERVFTGDKVKRMLGQMEEISLWTGGSNSAANSISDTIPALWDTEAVAPSILLQHLPSLVQMPTCPFLQGKVNAPAAGPAKALSQEQRKASKQRKGTAEKQVNKRL